MEARSDAAQMNLLLGLILGLFLVIEGAEAISKEDVGNLASAEKLLKDSKTYSNGTAILYRLIKSKDRTMSYWAREILAKALRERGKLDQALAMATGSEKLVPKIPVWGCGLLYERTRCLLEKGETQEAMKYFSTMESRNQGVVRIYGLMGLGEGMMALKNLEKAKGYLQIALSYGTSRYEPQRPYSMGGTYAEVQELPEGHERWPWLKPRIKTLLEAVLRQIDIERYGEDFVLYRAAEDLRGIGMYETSLIVYDEVIEKFPETVFAEASRCYRNISLFEMDRVGKARKGLVDFLEKDRYGLFRGEVFRLLGEYSLEKQSNLRGAKPWYEDGIKWVEQSTLNEATAQFYEIPNKALSVAKPPDAVWKVDKWGDIVRTGDLPAGVVINRRTAKWYLSELAKEFHFKLGFIHFAAGNKQKALKEFAEILPLDRLISKAVDDRIPNVYDRLEVACKTGILSAQPEDLRYFQGRDRVKVLLADFYMVMGEFGKAKAIYNAFRSDGTRAQKAYATVALAYCLHFEGDVDGAQALYKETLEMGRGGYASAHAMLALGWHLYGKGDETSVNKAKTLFAECYKRFPGTDFGMKALAYLAITAAWEGRESLARRYAAELKRRYPKSRFAATAEEALREMEERLAKRQDSEEEGQE